MRVNAAGQVKAPLGGRVDYGFGVQHNHFCLEVGAGNRHAEAPFADMIGDFHQNAVCALLQRNGGFVVACGIAAPHIVFQNRLAIDPDFDAVVAAAFQHGFAGMNTVNFGVGIGDGIVGWADGFCQIDVAFFAGRKRFPLRGMLAALVIGGKIGAGVQQAWLKGGREVQTDSIGPVFERADDFPVG